MPEMDGLKAIKSFRNGRRSGYPENDISGPAFEDFRAARLAGPSVTARKANRRLIVQDDVQQGAIDGQVTVILDQSQAPEFVHEEADPGPGRADHLRQGLLADFGDDRFGFFVLAEIRQDQEQTRETFLAGVE